MVMLRRTVLFFTILTILLIGVLGFLNSSANSGWEGFYLFNVSLVLIICIFATSMIMFVQCVLGERYWLVTKIISTILLLFSLIFIIWLLLADKESGANIGLGLLGLTIHFLGLVNAILILVHIVLGRWKVEG